MCNVGTCTVKPEREKERNGMGGIKASFTPITAKTEPHIEYQENLVEY